MVRVDPLYYTNPPGCLPLSVPNSLTSASCLVGGELPLQKEEYWKVMWHAFVILKWHGLAGCVLRATLWFFGKLYGRSFIYHKNLPPNKYVSFQHAYVTSGSHRHIVFFSTSGKHAPHPPPAASRDWRLVGVSSITAPHITVSRDLATLNNRSLYLQEVSNRNTYLTFKLCFQEGQVSAMQYLPEWKYISKQPFRFQMNDTHT